MLRCQNTTAKYSLKWFCFHFWPTVDTECGSLDSDAAFMTCLFRLSPLQWHRKILRTSHLSQMVNKVAKTQCLKQYVWKRPNKTFVRQWKYFVNIRKVDKIGSLCIAILRWTWREGKAWVVRRYLSFYLKVACKEDFPLWGYLVYFCGKTFFVLDILMRVRCLGFLWFVVTVIWRSCFLTTVG